MLNKAIIMGRMVKDIEVRQTQSGKMVGSFTVAIDDGYGDNKTTDFINCIAWEKKAEFIKNHFGKGRMIAIVGKIKTRSWEAEGGKRFATELRVDEVDFTGEKKEESAPESIPDGFMPMPKDDDLPF